MLHVATSPSCEACSWGKWPAFRRAKNVWARDHASRNAFMKAALGATMALACAISRRSPFDEIAQPSECVLYKRISAKHLARALLLVFQSM